MRKHPRSQCTAPLPCLPWTLTPNSSHSSSLIETMKNIQASQQWSKIVVKSRNYKETIDLTKLQNGMLQLFHATGDTNWDDTLLKISRSQNFCRVSKTSSPGPLSNLFITIFQTEPEDDDDVNHTNPLNRLMSLVVFPPKFTKGHLNMSFQSSDLETGLLYK